MRSFALCAPLRKKASDSQRFALLVKAFASRKKEVVRIIEKEIKAGAFLTMEIYNNPSFYTFLTSYYAQELSDPYFYREIEEAADMRLLLSEQFAAWLPFDKHHEEITKMFRAI